MKIRIILKAYNSDLISTANNQLRAALLASSCKISGTVALPIRIKRFCVLRSPHADKDSREHFEIRIFKRFFDAEINSKAIFDSLLKFETPSGVSCSLKLKN